MVSVFPWGYHETVVGGPRVLWGSAFKKKCAHFKVKWIVINAMNQNILNMENTKI